MRALLFTALVNLSLQSQTPTAPPPTAAEVGIDEKLGGFVAKDVIVSDEDGKSIRLGSLITKPTILTLNYFRCAGICTPQLNGLAEVVGRTKPEAGKDYQILTLSFDERDTPDIAAQKRINYLKQVGRPVSPEGWRFLTGPSLASRAVADSVGFKFKAEGDEFIHAGALMILSPEGKVTRYMYGTSYLAADLEMALTEAAKGEVRPTINKWLKFCFNTDPSGRVTTLNLTRVSAIVLILGAVVFGVVAARRGRRPVPTDTKEG